MSKFKAPKIPKPVRIDWIDSMGTAGWTTIPDETDLRCTTVGMFVRKTRERVIVQLNHSHETGGGGHYIEIPRVAIKRMRFLKE